MAVTNGERLMIMAMKNIGASEDDIIGVMVMLTTVEQRKQMLIWLKNNREATPSDMLKQAVTIKKRWPS